MNAVMANRMLHTCSWFCVFSFVTSS